MARAGKGGKQACAAGIAAVTLCLVPTAMAQTSAGAAIVNTARLTAISPATTIDSNTVTLTIGEIVEAAIVAERATQPLRAQVDTAFTIRNPGNAAGSFVVAASAGSAAMPIAIDANDDGQIDADERAAATTQPTTVLAAGGTRRIVVLVRDAGTAPLTVDATVTAVRGHGAPGTAIDGDAVIGTSGARAQASTRLVQDEEPAGRLEKTQAVRAPDGSSRVVAGAVITYTLVASFARACRDATIVDAVPAGTAFVPSSITVDGQPATEAPDADVAQLDAGRVRVALGDVSAGTTRTITFQAVIQ